MQLYKAKRNSWVIPTTETTAPPGAREVQQNEPVLFHHIDGMYSYCTDIHGEIVHLPAWQEVEYANIPDQ